MHEKSTILYIEDNCDNQRLVSRVLEARGFRVVLAGDGPTGIEIAASTQLGMVLVDMNIPTLDGYETATRLRSIAHLRTTPIVALTADVRPGVRERTLAAGCDGYISKPIDPRELPTQVTEFITGKREALPLAEETVILREYSQRLVQRLEQQIHEVTAANRELQQVDELKNQFIGTISHELRTPLTAIVGFVELFERGTLGPLTVTQQEALQVVTRNARQLAEQLNSLIYLQQVRASQVKRAPLLVHEVLRRVLVDVSHRAEEAGVQVRAQLPPTALIEGDQSAIEHALRQIVDNAIKFTSRGGQITVAAQDTADGVLVIVRDTGIGIPPESLGRVFEPFYRVDSSVTRNYNGVGIGLAVAQHVVQAHGGEIKLRSEEGKGTLVQVTLKR